MLPSCRRLAAFITLALCLHVSAQQQPPADAERFTTTTTKLIAAINANDQPAIQQMFNEAMQQALPVEKTGPFFREVLSAKGQLQSAGTPEVNGSEAKVRVDAERGAWQFQITLDPSGKIAGLRVVPGDDTPVQNGTPPADVTTGDKQTYFDLRQSKDRFTQQLAERYFNLVRAQEWADATGKFKTIAKYVDHDPQLQWVSLEITKGRGAAPQVKQIPVAKLSKTCQTRVRQIAKLQPKLDELAAGGSAADPGSPMMDERGREPRDVRNPDPASAAARDRPVRHAAQPASGPTQIQSSPDADPLGFSEIPAGPAMAGGPGLSFTFAAPGESPGAPPPEASRPRQAWETDYLAFRSTFTVSQGERGEPVIDWGGLRALRALGNLAADPPKDDPEVSAEEMAYFGAVRLNWEAPFQAIRETEPGTHTISFDLPPLPQPLQIEFQPDKEGKRSSIQEWMRFAPREQVQFTGRLHMKGPTSIVIYVDEPQPAAAGAGAAPPPQ